MWSVELAQFPQHVAVNARVTSALRRAQTPHRLSTRPQTRKALGGVEVEVPSGDEWPESEERLYVGQLRGRVRDEELGVHEVQLTTWKHGQPVTDVTRVQTDADRRPRRVHLRLVGVQERSTLERPLTPAAAAAAAAAVRRGGLSLREVRQRPCDWITHDDQQPDVRRHVVDSLRHAARHQVARRLLDGQLTNRTQRHPRSDTHTHTHRVARPTEGTKRTLTSLRHLNSAPTPTVRMTIVYRTGGIP